MPLIFVVSLSFCLSICYKTATKRETPGDCAVHYNVWNFNAVRGFCQHFCKHVTVRTGVLVNSRNDVCCRADVIVHQFQLSVVWCVDCSEVDVAVCQCCRRLLG